MGRSMRTNFIKPLVPKKQFRQSVEEVKGAQKKEELLGVIKEVEKDRNKPHELIYKDIQDRKREQLENQQLLHLLTDSLRKLPISNHFDEDGFIIKKGESVQSAEEISITA